MITQGFSLPVSANQGVDIGRESGQQNLAPTTAKHHAHACICVHVCVCACIHACVCVHEVLFQGIHMSSDDFKNITKEVEHIILCFENLKGNSLA